MSSLPRTLLRSLPRSFKPPTPFSQCLFALRSQCQFNSRRHKSRSASAQASESTSTSTPSPNSHQLSSTPASSGAQPLIEKKRPAKKAAAKSSLRKAAAGPDRQEVGETKVCTAYCTAEKYDLSEVSSLLRNTSYIIDPTRTGLADQVLHLRVPSSDGDGDVFIFPTGNIVSWSVPTAEISALANLITPAAEHPYLADIETEDLEYVEDPRLKRSRVGGDVIILGTASSTNYVISDSDMTTPEPSSSPSSSSSSNFSTQPPPNPTDDLNLTLAKIAFSSGLARSTKLAVLESLLNDYLETTSTIPLLLSRGSRLPFTRSFILRKTGELLQFRAQLNLYSELTDSLPDIFWDSRHDLGLEGYYGAVGRALDVDVRIRQLNEKLDYAGGIVEVLREQLSERHSLGLEWMIIVLIAVEVGFEIMRQIRERGLREREEYEGWKAKREREMDEEYQEYLKSKGRV